MTLLNIVSAWLPVLLWSGLIFYFSSIPGLKTSLGFWDFVLRKMAHVVEYAILGHLVVRAFVLTRRGWSARKIIISAFCICFCYAVSDEIHQAFVPARGPSYRDIMIDVMGIACGIWFSQKRYFSGAQYES